MVVDNKKCGEEEVKYACSRDGFIKKVSKKIKEKDCGEALGINLVKKRDLNVFMKHLERISEVDYYEKAIEDMIEADNVKIAPVSIGKLFCEEIDFLRDLEDVKSHLNGVR